MWNSLKNQGDLIEERGLRIFFGNHLFHPSFMEGKLHCYRVHQVHGDRLVKASPQLTKADAHWTSQKGKALLIQTADCMPAFLSDKKRSFICALHIGWRGLAQRILSKTVEALPTTHNLELWVGPHIKQKSFCLDPASTEFLLEPHGHPEKKDKSIFYPTAHRREQNSIDLEKVLRMEAQSLDLEIRYFSKTNTYTSVQHHSHRRYPYGKGRQWSFICLSSSS